MATKTPSINVLPSWGTNLVAINYKLGWNSPDFHAYLEEWLRIPHNLELVIKDTEFAKIPARVLSLALLHRKCVVLSPKRDGSVLYYGASVKSVAKSVGKVHVETMRLKEFQDRCVHVIFPLVLAAAQDVEEAEEKSKKTLPDPHGPAVVMTVVDTQDGKEYKGLFHAFDNTMDFKNNCIIKSCEEISSSKTSSFRQQFIKYAADVKTLEFMTKGMPKSIGQLTVMEILRHDPHTEQRLQKTHRELSRRHDVFEIYHDAFVAKTHVRTALMEDPHMTYKHQVMKA
jgi:small nuclear ribonucleoprotein (snRNP)-like protein